ncbi:hypothetical protein NEMBOFW57_005273 [Staphylotrichum longicolle]|uniref:VOC domain-containing protein n=1 Tax=Staphylotrichum longicolle TaxID=669026 RepID=A0AAD4EWH9_9PEZI|nr:hypothetical protein NEMBOFW57_005273 [Staphylotrichum longicolle]
MALAAAHVRIARPTDDIDSLLPFYRDGLGFEVLGSFADHQGFDGVMLGHKSAGYHLEFTRHRGHDVGRAPTQDHLLIFYLPDSDSHARAVAQMEGSGFPPVASFNPYWDQCGRTFEDPDGYRVVLAKMAPPHLSSIGEAHTQTSTPAAKLCLRRESPVPLSLHVQFQPRYSLYLDSEEYGEFIVNAEFSHSSKWANKLIFSINIAETDDPLVQNTVPVNSTDTSSASPSPPPTRLEPSKSCSTAPLKVARLLGPPLPPLLPPGQTLRQRHPHRQPLRRPLLPQLPHNHTFVPLLPYGFYASYDHFLRENDTALVDAYAARGLNAMTPLATMADSAALLTHMALPPRNIRFMYSLRDGYKNLSHVSANVVAARDAEGLFAYWTADEPDGWQDPFAAPRDAYALVKRLDPYHPVAVTLNCQDYHYAEYSDGAAADFLMADVYPIGINATWSKWGTACNATHGDCGCDNCAGAVQDVARRLDDLKRYQAWLGRWRKTVVFNPQSFHGEDYWLRDPSVEESWVMALLALNHDAKGVISWLWPTSEALAGAHGKLASVVTRGEVVGFLVGGEPRKVEVEVPGTEVVDVASWVMGGKMLVSVVNGGYVDVARVEVPVSNATVVESTPWGSVRWALEGAKLTVPLLPALSTSLVILDLRD